MAAAPVIAAIASVVGAGAAVVGTIQADERAKKAASANAKAIKLEAEEEKRRLAIEQEGIESEALAKSAASGVRGATVDQYLKGLKQEHAKELAWVGKSGESRASAAKAGANVGGAFGTLATAASGVQGVISSGTNAGWWG